MTIRSVIEKLTMTASVLLGRAISVAAIPVLAATALLLFLDLGDSHAVLRALATFVALLVAAAWAQAAVVEDVRAYTESEPLQPFHRLYGRMWRFALRLAGAQLLIGLATAVVALVCLAIFVGVAGEGTVPVVVATVAGLVPALVLMLNWSLVPPLVVIERLGAATAMSRSSGIVERRRLRILVVYLAVGGFIFAVALVTQIALSLAFEDSIAALIGGALWSTLYGAAVGLVTTSVYYAITQGIPTDAVASVAYEPSAALQAAARLPGERPQY